MIVSPERSNSYIWTSFQIKKKCISIKNKFLVEKKIRIFFAVFLKLLPKSSNFMISDHNINLQKKWEVNKKLFFSSEKMTNWDNYIYDCSLVRQRRFFIQYATLVIYIYYIYVYSISGWKPNVFCKYDHIYTLYLQYIYIYHIYIYLYTYITSM